MVSEVSARSAWEALLADPRAVLVDVRTPVEWERIGVPDLAQTGKTLVRLSWQLPPAGALHPDFLGALAAAGVSPDRPVFFLCRSGARSLAAALAAEDAGYGRAINVRDGFEGPPDATGQRGRVAGWQAEGLPTRS